MPTSGEWLPLFSWPAQSAWTQQGGKNVREPEETHPFASVPSRPVPPRPAPSRPVPSRPLLARFSAKSRGQNRQDKAKPRRPVMTKRFYPPQLRLQVSDSCLCARCVIRLHLLKSALKSTDSILAQTRPISARRSFARPGLLGCISPTRSTPTSDMSRRFWATLRPSGVCETEE